MVSRNSIARAAVGLASTLISVSVASADNTAMSPKQNTGTQNFDTLFGMDFDVNGTTPISVTQLGVFDNKADSILLTDSNSTQPIVIQIWNRDTATAVASASFGAGTGNGTATVVGSGQYFFKPITPITLAAGGHYYVSEDFSGSELFFNSGGDLNSAPVADNSGLITFVGSGRASNGHNTFYVTGPNGFLDQGPATRYAGPNFTFVAVPEPGILGVLAFGALGALSRRRGK